MAAPVSGPSPIGVNPVGQRVIGIGSPPAHMLEAADTPQDGTVTLDNQVCRCNWGLQVITTGSPAACVVELWLSINGINWWKVGQWSMAGGQASGDLVAFIDKPAIAAYCKLATLSGGTSPTVDAWVCGQ